MPKKIFAIGELLWDLLPDGQQKPGGAPANFCYRINFLGNTGLLVTRLGHDELGRKAAGEMKKLGLDTKYIQWDDKMPTGTVNVFYDNDRNPDFIINPGVAYDRIEISDILTDDIKTADCIYFGTLVQRAKKTRETVDIILSLSNNILKFLDINLRKDCYSKETITKTLSQADILKLNDDEVLKLKDIFHISENDLLSVAFELIKRFQIAHCLITLADKGALYLSLHDDIIYSPGFCVDLQDPIGSGDAFAAGFVHRFLEGYPLWEACEYGNVLGAITATKTGACPVMSYKEIQDFQKNNSSRNIDTNFKEYIH